MNTFKPMLAYSLEESDLNKLTYPIIVQPKIDGIRCIILEGKVLSRTLKPIPNDYIRGHLNFMWENLNKPYLIDGELTVGQTFQSCSSGIMSKEGVPDYEYHIFDYAQNITDLKATYFNRITNIHMEVDQALVYTRQSLDIAERNSLLQLNEGIILRNPNAPYKFGRSTFKEGALMKFKRFEDAEAVIVGMEPQYRNDNPAETDNLGHTKHSSHQENMTPLDTLGTFLCIGITGEFKGIEFKVGSGKGLTKMRRKEIWKNRYKYDRKIIKYQYQKIGSKNKPRILTFIGFRED